MSAVSAVQDVLACQLTTATHPVAWVSGGKDSLTLLHLLRPWAAQVPILHVALDTGWPGVTENLTTLAQAWGFTLSILPAGMPYAAYVAQYGWPVEVVPTAHQGPGNPLPSPYFVQGSIRMAPWTHCQAVRLQMPLLCATADLQADLVFTGSRGSDAPLFAEMGAWVPTKAATGWNRCNPLAEWSTDEVYAYIDAEGIPLPPHYAWKRTVAPSYEPPDCLGCTWQPAHFAILKAYDPDAYTQWWPHARAVYVAGYQALMTYRRALKKAVHRGGVA